MDLIFLPLIATFWPIAIAIVAFCWMFNALNANPTVVKLSKQFADFMEARRETKQHH